VSNRCGTFACGLLAVHAELDGRVTVCTRERHVDALKKSYETVDIL